MSLTVITGWAPAGWAEYGARFAETFDRYWPPEVNLLVYGEEPRELPNTSGRFIQFVDVRTIPGCGEFLIRHRAEVDRPANGLEPKPGWKERAIAAGYNWRFDAWKFCRQAFIPFDALDAVATDYLCWLDGDVVTHARVPSVRTITGLLPPDRVVAYLGREPKHPDIAFQLYRLHAPPSASRQSSPTRARRLLECWRNLYASDEVFSLKEWHSAYVWQEAARRTDVRLHNLTPHGHGHVWHQSPLRMWGDHLKGARKANGRSPERR